MAKCVCKFGIMEPVLVSFKGGHGATHVDCGGWVAVYQRNGQYWPAKIAQIDVVKKYGKVGKAD